MSEELRPGDLCVGTKKWWLLPGSNQRPVDYDSIALPTELSSQPEVVKIKWLRQQDSNLRQGG